MHKGEVYTLVRASAYFPMLRSMAGCVARRKADGTIDVARCKSFPQNEEEAVAILESKTTVWFDSGDVEPVILEDQRDNNWAFWSTY